MKHSITKTILIWVKCFNCGKRWKSNGLLTKYECPECTMEAEGEHKL